MKLQELVNLINVRDFASKNLDNIYFKIESSDIKLLRAKIAMLDKVILNEILTLNVQEYKESLKNKNEITK